MTTSGPRPVVTWILMALSAIAAFVLPNFSVDPIEGAKPCERGDRGGVPHGC